MILFNPLDKNYKSHTGAVCENTLLTIRVKYFDSVVFVYRKDGEDQLSYIDMTKNGSFCECLLKLPVGLYWYSFMLPDGLFIGSGANLLGEVTDAPVFYQLSVYREDYTLPKWLKGGIIYQIFPDRFCSSGGNLDKKKVYIHKDKSDTPIYLPNEEGQVLNNDFFGGDIKGIISKLDYLKELNVSAIYLNPIFKAYSNHRYDTGDYMTIDPLLGTEKDLIELINRAKALDIRIILDGVFNHTGDDSIYFNRYGNYPSVGAYQSKNSPYYDWFNFISYPNDYESWWGIKTLPQVNEASEGYLDYITGKDGVLEHYTKLGIGGWRLDVVDELPAPFVRSLRRAVKGVDGDAIIIGEVWEDASNKVAYGVRREYFMGGELDSVMNYPLKDAIISFVKYGDSENLSNVINRQIDHYPSEVLHSLMNLLSTHDTARLLSAVSDFDANGKSKTELSRVIFSGEKRDLFVKKLKIASLLQYTLMGVPSVYYGDEIGMQGFIDPLNRKFFDWNNIDKDILSHYKLLGKIRSSYSAFSGKYSELYSKKGAFIFTRTSENSEVLVGANMGKEQISLKYDGKLVNLIDGKTYSGEVILKSYEFGIFVAR